MNFKEFNKWTKDLYTPPQVNEAGDIENDRVLKFELSYGDAPEVKKAPILAVTLAEAIYRSLYLIQIETCPNDVEISAASDAETIQSIKTKLISKLTFTDFIVKEIDPNEDSISFMNNGVEYTLTCENYNFKEVFGCMIEDDIVVLWSKPNNNDMICYICYNMTNLALNLKEINKIDNLMQLSGLVKNNLFTHSNFLVCQFGFSSITEEDMEDDKYSNRLAQDVSYKRALSNKLILDKKIIKEQLDGLKHDYDILHTAIKRYNKMNSKLSKRIHDIRHSIFNRISSHYNLPKSE